MLINFATLPLSNFFEKKNDGFRKILYLRELKRSGTRTCPGVSGSGNTRNIGGITNSQKLLNGQGPFADLGEEVFDDYWKGYFNKVDARTAGIGAPRYNNLKTYKQYFQQQQGLLKLL